MTAKEVYETYVAVATKANAKVKTFKSFKNKAEMQAEIDRLTPKKQQDTVATFSGKKEVIRQSLTKVQRAFLRRWAQRNAIEGHEKGKRWVGMEVPVELLDRMG